MVVEAPAKINWFLEVLRKRDDGFHEILTVMQTIAWRDRLTFAPRNDGRIEFTTDAPGLPRDERNLVVKAALALQSASNKVFGATIHLEKCIPTGAGLGGGSSDAATTLMALNDLWNLDYDSNRLTQIASTLGSDIPFFLYGPLARCGGRGEIVSKMSNARTVPMVVVWPGVEVPSATIYRSGLIDLTSPREKCNFSYDLLAAGQGVSRHIPSSVVFNRLGSPCEKLFGLVGTALTRARECVKDRVISLSGSGSAFFIVCDSPTDAEAIGKSLQPEMPPGSIVRVTHTLAS